MPYAALSKRGKNYNDSFLIFAQNIDCAYTVYVQSKNEKNGIPLNPPFYFLKVGSKGVFIAWTCLHDVYWAL